MPEGHPANYKGSRAKRWFPDLDLSLLLAAITNASPARVTPSLLVEDGGAPIQNMENFPDVNILALTNLLKTHFFKIIYS